MKSCLLYAYLEVQNQIPNVPPRSINFYYSLVPTYILTHGDELTTLSRSLKVVVSRAEKSSQIERTQGCGDNSIKAWHWTSNKLEYNAASCF